MLNILYLYITLYTLHYKATMSSSRGLEDTLEAPPREKDHLLLAPGWSSTIHMAPDCLIILYTFVYFILWTCTFIQCGPGQGCTLYTSHCTIRLQFAWFNFNIAFKSTLHFLSGTTLVRILHRIWVWWLSMRWRINLKPTGPNLPNETEVEFIRSS